LKSHAWLLWLQLPTLRPTTNQLCTTGEPKFQFVFTKVS
jgi:hypothetical protein